ncbi:hypothetical protein HYO98_gp11 [Dinoroseobacter phage DS-1410Ws-06]|uniref:Uncharacterized protein n=1 Tax=Dinoroseobacter phage DS-1410Ws-06 TaxID=1815983 RepID=A0A191VY81_9CAUD|nr:hypothetical protein HYO98_gp11 [Dinoroseobacter phage DS-1410Ws-06]ANJ20668.1 hypothetical protein DSp06_gp11 [Dinoroseobacter phage DS-1410Ws-06]
MKLFFQSLIMGFCMAGVTAISAEFGGSIQEPLFWMIFVVLGLTAFALVRGYPELEKREWIEARNKYDDEDHAKRMSRVRIIQNICNQNMKTAELGKPFPKKEHVVVRYDDLLRIWDNAGRIEYSE